MTDIFDFNKFRWIGSKTKFHFTDLQTNKALCGHQFINPSYEPKHGFAKEFVLPAEFLLPRSDSICKKCDLYLWKKSFIEYNKRKKAMK